MNFTLKQLRYVEAAGRLGSIAKAAEEQAISQSSITAAIDALEHELDYHIFVRTPAKGIRPTPTGQEALQMIRGFINHSRHFEADLASVGSDETGVVRIGCYGTAAPAFLPPILVALMVPPEAAMLPNFLSISSIGGRDTLWGIILPGLGTAFGTFMLRQQFKTLPAELMEAAELDGAGHWRRLWQIVAPVSTPTIATVALVVIVNEWNNFLWPLVIIDSPEKMTLPVGLNLLRSIETQTGSYGILMAGAVVVIAPVLIVFAALQRYIVAGLTQGAVK